ncbi:hypothetical protein NDU88_006473 [Pleurodeles waltl]|uniref:Uncharacterized protein n=1 Tax=Pleurodeles waltl TaxID=8319 RepID=A0AAV7WEX2_PLEWA|nr:hypothetical protein NDU88_006473 [Pleurodeles waltl]
MHPRRARKIEALEQKIDAMIMDLALLRDDHRHSVKQVTASERKLSETTSVVTEASNRLNDVEQRLKVLEARVEDAENRARRNSIPEKIEKNDMVGYLETSIV